MANKNLSEKMAKFGHWYLGMMINPIRRSEGVYKNINFQSDIGDWSVEMYLIAIIALEINRH